MGLFSGITKAVAGIGLGPIAAGLGSAGLDFATSIMNRNAQKKINSQNISNSWDMWNANNSYNDPSAQMERFRKAGLNPNLIYGSGSGSAGNASGSLPVSQSPGGINASSVGQAVENALNLKQRLSNLEASRLSNENLGWDASIKKSMADMKKAEYDYFNTFNLTPPSSVQEKIFRDLVLPGHYGYNKKLPSETDVKYKAEELSNPFSSPTTFGTILQSVLSLQNGNYFKMAKDALTPIWKNRGSLYYRPFPGRF